MTNAVGSNPIAFSSIAGDDDDEEETGFLLKKRKRVRVIRNRYEGINADAVPVAAAMQAEPTPTYDGLPAEKRTAVDRLAVAVRMKQTQGLI